MDPNQRGQLLSDVQHNRPYGNSNAGYNAGDQDQNNKPALHKRIRQKLTGHGDPDAHAVDSMQAPLLPGNDTKQDFAAAATHAALAQALLELAQPRNVAVVSSLVTELTGQVGMQMISSAARPGTRVFVREAVAGALDGLEVKITEWLPAVPPLAFMARIEPVRSMMTIFLIGIFLAVWRVALFGT